MFTMLPACFVCMSGLILLMAEGWPQGSIVSPVAGLAGSPGLASRKFLPKEYDLIPAWGATPKRKMKVPSCLQIQHQLSYIQHDRLHHVPAEFF